MAALVEIILLVVIFLVSLAVLVWGADGFVDNTAIIARRTGVSPLLIGLLTAGAEWEELFVVVSAITQRNPDLAIGNIIGSCISNILGAFSLGLLFNRSTLEFDRSAKLYSAILLVVTALASLMIESSTTVGMRRVMGMFLLAGFGIYLLSIGLGIQQGLLVAPEDSDDSDSDTAVEEEATTAMPPRGFHEHSPLLRRIGTDEQASDVPNDSKSLGRHILLLALGFLAILISSPVLAYTAKRLASLSAMSDTLFGVAILSIATTIPEKVIALFSGFRGQGAILTANTVGSNVFLLTLCLGILWISAPQDRQVILLHELWFLLGSSAALALGVWTKGGVAKAAGALMLSVYIVFIVLEFTVIRKV